MDHPEEQDQRWAKLTALACPECGVHVLTIEPPISPFVWCEGCPGTPRLERSAT
jgi:hypothetical protein